MPHFLLVTAGIIYQIWGECFPRCAVIDLEMRTIQWVRIFSVKSIPSKLKQTELLPLGDLTALCLSHRKDLTVRLSVLRKDGVTIPVAIANQQQAEQLLSDTADLAEELGRIPVITL